MVNMVNLEPAPEQLEVAELARELGVEVLAPAAREAEAARAVPENVWKTLFATGLTVPVPEELGGSGIGDTATLMIALENLAYGDPGITLAAFSSGAAALLLARHGGSDHAALVRSLITEPGTRAAVALYEPQGRGASEFATTIEVTGDEVRVRGRKVAVAFGAEADPLIVVGVEQSAGGVRAVLVPRTAPGLTVTPHGGSLALEAMAPATVAFDTAVPVSNLLDASGLLNTIGRIRLAVAAIAVGTGQRAVDYAAQYATERVAFGRPIASFQGVSFPLAEAQMRMAESRLEIAESAARLDDDAAEDVSRAVGYAGEVAAEATRAAVQTLGGHGFIAEHPVELWYRSAAALSTLDFDPVCSSFQAAL